METLRFFFELNAFKIILFKRNSMFNIFKKKNPKEALIKQAKKLEEEAFRLSKTDRKASDLKTAEAQELWKQIEAMS